MTRQEAHFWFVAMTESTRRDVSPAMLVDELRTQSDRFRGDITREEVVARMWSIASDPQQWHADTGQLLVLSMNLFSPEDWIALSRQTSLASRPYSAGQINQIRLNAFAKMSSVFTETECQAKRDRSRPDLASPSLPPKPNTAFPMAVYLAAALGMHEEVQHILQLMPDDLYSQPNYYDVDHRRQLLVLGLGSPSARRERNAAAEADPQDARRRPGLDRPHRGLRPRPGPRQHSGLNQEGQVRGILRVLARVKSPKTAAPMLELMLASKASGVAHRWLDEQVGHAIAGLIPVVAERGKLADAALEYLRTQQRKGHEGFIRECLASAPSDTAEKVRRLVLERTEVVIPTLDAESTPDWLQSAQNDVKKLKPPGWITPGDLPPIIVGGRRLNEEQAKAVLASLTKSTLGAAHPLVAAVNAHADRPSLDAFAWASWAFVGRSRRVPKEKWAMSTSACSAPTTRP